MSKLLSDSSRNRQIGIALVTVTTLMFAVLDASAKWLVQSLPVLQVVWLRFLFHTLFTAAFFVPGMGAPFGRKRRSCRDSTRLSRSAYSVVGPVCVVVLANP
jgi:drug/metabolite transporter (DMT)-like permease